jgi:AAA15 family ATPase/GTPase
MTLDVESNSFQRMLVQRLKYKTIPFDYNKSSGTHSLELYYYWSRMFDRVSFLFIDEFDAYYHYELAERIIRRTVESVDIQVVFTSHNSGLVDNSIMRPDCYLLLDDGRLRSLVDSTTRELREAHNLEKMLRNGEFDE